MSNLKISIGPFSRSCFTINLPFTETSIGIYAPNFGTLINTGITYIMLNGMLRCINLFDSHRHKTGNTVKYVTLGLGALSLIEFKNSSGDLRTIHRDKIDLLCLKEPNKYLNLHQESTFNKICESQSHNSQHDLEMLCVIMGDQEICSNI